MMNQKLTFCFFRDMLDNVDYMRLNNKHVTQNSICLNHKSVSAMLTASGPKQLARE